MLVIAGEEVAGGGVVEVGFDGNGVADVRRVVGGGNKDEGSSWRL